MDFRGPVVYLVLRDGVPMYAGMSGRGLMRPFDDDHHVLSTKLGAADTLRVWPVPSVEVAREIERALIEYLMPEWNADAPDAVSDEERVERARVFRQTVRYVESTERAVKKRGHLRWRGVYEPITMGWDEILRGLRASRGSGVASKKRLAQVENDGIMQIV